MIRELIKGSYFTISDGNVINMGYQNGWVYSEDVVKLYKDLVRYRIEGTQYSTTIGRCETEYGCKLFDGVEEFTLISKVDSSD
jgi:hypothetical protein